MSMERKLIDANEFHAYLEDVRQIYLEEDTFSSNFAAEVIETVQDEYLATAPTVDAVEVVRCKDCASYEEQFPGRGYCYYWDYEQGMSPNSVDEDGFCSNAERRNVNGKGNL